MQITMTGGTGFIGRYLTLFFLDKGYQVTAIGRRTMDERSQDQNLSFVKGDTTKEGPWQEAIEKADVVINLAGQTILNPWTKAYKKKIEASRVLTTQNVVSALTPKTRLLFNASAVGFYGNRGEMALRESDAPGDDFLARVAIEWEKEAEKAKEKNVRVVMGRFGIILGRDGGALKKMIPAFKMFMGGPLGDGSQWFPWMHIRDLARAIEYCIDNETVKGPLNFTAPQSTTNRVFVSALGKQLSRPTLTPAPKFMIRLMLGEFGETLLYSQKVIPEALTKNGFSFQFPDIDSALNDLIK